ncbi:hypothetical protein OsI_14994 [Oryza sativa Indica Group]|uniref:Uncharacterized protein n=1 Tax=Oryza sativa subsp. indica TaxID=39946 RepID=B8AVR4_ORYSI|nr:hypothetical protein OsI_14994 [Oryza sativa Indica Group]
MPSSMPSGSLPAGSANIVVGDDTVVEENDDHDELHPVQQCYCCSVEYTKGSQSMKSALVTVLVVLLLITSSTALARKLAADDGQQKAESQAKSEVNIDGKPSSGYGEHVCPRDMYPNCFQRMKKLTSSNHLG